MQVMRDQDPQLFFRFYRMSPQLFDKLHRLVAERLTKQHVVREPITSGERLAMTLRYLSSGNPIMDIAMEFRVGLETAREAIHLTCQVLWEELAPRYMKDTFSIVLMAVADSSYVFRLIDVGAPGRMSDGGVLKSADELGLPFPTLESLRLWLTLRRRGIQLGSWRRFSSYCGIGQGGLLGCCYAGTSLRLNCPLNFLADNFGYRQQSRLVGCGKQLPELFQDDVVNDLANAWDAGAKVSARRSKCSETR
ncbi:hypothetical protein HPB47_015574 [Ixodes persulcatus]|uniref:Uncharacterized protein n=1 Tax=Ixodes persulcatus TaxID=34615 RepID=A0AC60QV38_IXOPE|nr:hypothetical protein HPB47_015574 [Ixodes persulcatus]